MRQALEHSREDLGRMHRETLEIRLATEELWLRISGHMDTDTLKQSIAKIREHLADQFRDSIARMEEQKSELRQLREQVVEQQQRLAKRREELEQWSKRCEEAFHERDRQLRQREQGLEFRQNSYNDRVAGY